MTLFAEKGVFNLLGLEAVQKSTLHISQDCTICTKPLDMQPSVTQKEVNKKEEEGQSKLHKAVRIIACGHVVGEKCLDAWLDTSHRCPICNRELFEAKGALITQQDIDSVVRSLSRYFGKNKIMVSVSRVTKLSGGGYVAQRQVRGSGMQYAQIQKGSYGAYDGGEPWSSGEEMEFDDEDEDEDEEDEELEDYEDTE